MQTKTGSDHQATLTQRVHQMLSINRLILKVIMILMLSLLAGCSAMNQTVSLPPVAQTPSAEIQDGRFVWIDLVTEDVVAAASFYSRLFGWRAARSSENGEYYLFYLDGKPVAGMAASESKDATAPESLWLVTMSVSNVDQGVTAVKTHGGKVLEGPLDAAGRGRMALVSDAADAPFILLEAGGEKPAGSRAMAGQWFWTDLVTQGGKRARAFYTAMAGYEVKQTEAADGHRYDNFKRNGRPVAGLVELEWDGLEDNWLPYIKVADVDRSIETARNSGGKMILQSGKVAVLADPTGAVFSIQMR